MKTYPLLIITLLSTLLTGSYSVAETSQETVSHYIEKMKNLYHSQEIPTAALPAASTIGGATLGFISASLSKLRKKSLKIGRTTKDGAIIGLSLGLIHIISEKIEKLAASRKS